MVRKWKVRSLVSDLKIRPSSSLNELEICPILRAASTLPSELIGILLAQLWYKDAIEIQAQTATLPPLDPYQASWRKGIISYPASHLAYLNVQWYVLVPILLPRAEGSPPFCSGPPDRSRDRTQDCRISLLTNACILPSELIGILQAQLWYKDAIQMQAQTATLSSLSLQSAIWQFS